MHLMDDFVRITRTTMLAHQANDVIGTKCQVFLSFHQEVEAVFSRIWNTKFWSLSLVNVDVQVEEAEPPAIKKPVDLNFYFQIGPSNDAN